MQHFEEQHAQSVVIEERPVSVSFEHLGAHVFGRPAEGIGDLVSAGQLLGEPEIRELDMSVDIEEDVFGLRA